MNLGSLAYFDASARFIPLDTAMAYLRGIARGRPGQESIRSKAAQAGWRRASGGITLNDILKFHKYAFAWENYLLLARAIRAAIRVRQSLGEKSASPLLSSSLKAVDRMYLPPQSGWRISDPEKIPRFANFIIKIPNH